MLFLPYRAGERLADPARTLHQGDVACTREIAYCVEASMSWMELDSPPSTG
ncbi:MAG TPA: hypothetical protein VD969_28680 [Symbiobacteriaceae bacterium]|nr:hypothetical protein [Symbiobacteriaceae bacterium]